MTFFVLLITTRFHIAVCDTRVRAMLLITKIRDRYWATHAGPFRNKTVPGPTGQKCGQDLGPVLGNPHGTHMKQVDKNRMVPIYRPRIVAQMGPVWGDVFVLTGFISMKVKWGFVIIANHSYEGSGFRSALWLSLLWLDITIIACSLWKLVGG